MVFKEHLWFISDFTTLALLPCLGYVVAKFATGLFLTRYVLAAAIGCSGLLTVLFAHRTEGGQNLAAIVAAFLIFSLCVVKLREARDVRPQLANLYRKLAELDSLPGTIAVAKLIPFLQYYFYAQPHLKSKLAMPIDAEAILTFTHSDTLILSDRPLREIGSVGQAVPELSDFLAQHPVFRVCDVQDSSHVWLLPALLSRGYRVTLESASGAESVYRITR